ncbi:MAG: hypothetical protein M1546_02705, partial [Chloroflexi bacterium]|nr:hypothetical protein [Chloroflexota bacterium]
MVLLVLLMTSSRASTASSYVNADGVNANSDEDSNANSHANSHAEVGLDNVYQSSIDTSDAGITVTVNVSGTQKAVLIACYPTGQCFRTAAALAYVPTVVNPPEPYSQKMIFAPRDDIGDIPLGINAEPRVTLLMWEVHGASKLELEVTGPVAPPFYNEQCVPGNLDTIQADGYVPRQRFPIDVPKGFI